MRKASLSLLALTLASSAAIAADLPNRAAPPVYLPPPIPAFTWDGVYAGVNAGYTETTGDTIGVTGRTENFGVLGSLLAGLRGGAALPTGATQRGGFIGGGQIGYNRQLGASVVAGVEADIQGLPSSGSTTNSSTSVPNLGPSGLGMALAPFFATQSTIERRIDYLGTVRGRLGYAFDRVLVYGTGGLAYGETKLGYGLTLARPTGLVAALLGASGGGGTNTSSKTSVGYTVGGGVEYAFTDHWSVKAEGLFYDLGRQSVTTAIASNTRNATASIRNDGYIARAGLNYRFGADPATVVARY